MIFGQSIRIKPAAGASVRKEDGLYLRPDGETVIASNYWLRRLNAGDIELVTPDDAVTTKSKPKG